jgi:glycine cleavage system transcriptional repressor
MSQSNLVVTALGEDKPGIVNELSRTVMDCGCNIEDSRMAVLGGEFAVILLVSGNWNTIAKLETQLQSVGGRLNMTVVTKRTGGRTATGDLLPYVADVVAIDHPGIVYSLASFFSSRNINIEEMQTSSYRAAHTGTPMFSVHIEIGVPSDVHIAQLREAFLDFCDELNLDGVLEPLKG